MSTDQRNAMFGGCLGSTGGLIAGAVLGLLIGAAVVGNAPTEPVSDDGQRETVRKLQTGVNFMTKAVGGAVGTVAGSLLGAAVGGGLGARLALNRANDPASKIEGNSAG